MKKYNIVVLPGDGIGTEVTAEALKVLNAVEPNLDGVRYMLTEYPVGAGEYQRNGDPMPPATFEACKQADAILLGAMGIPDVRWPDGRELAPQLDLREQLELYAGLRPVRLYAREDSQVRLPEGATIDLLLVRENTEGLFASREQKVAPDATSVEDTLRITRKGAERLFHAAFEEARKRRNKVSLIDKANVLPSMVFFRKIFFEVAKSYPDVEAEALYVDATALYLVQRPHTFDVMVTENLFGDILSDLAAGLVGGMGLAPSGDIGDHHGVFQPAHGSAPDIAGQAVANPIATILSAAMMLEWLNEPAAMKGAAAIRQAVRKVLEQPGNRTRDLGGSISTTQMGDRVAAALALE